MPMEPRELTVELESDPVVFELGREGGSDQRDAVLKIWGATGRALELRVAGRIVPGGPEAGAFRFTAAAAEIVDRSDDPEVPIRARVPVTCSGGGAEGQEATATLEVTVGF